MDKKKICPILSTADNFVDCLSEKCAWAFSFAARKEDIDKPPACLAFVIAGQLADLASRRAQA